MKIAHVVDSMEIGGAETLVAQMCRFQREQGHEPIVFAIASLGPLGEQLRKEGFCVHANVARHLPGAFAYFYRAFGQLRPDVVHAHNPTPSIYAAPAARLAGVRRVISTRHSLVGRPRKPKAEAKFALAATCCDWIVGICDATVENLNQMHTIPERKLTRVYNGVCPVTRVPAELWPSKTGFTLLFVGRLAPVKNVPVLLRAFSIARLSMPDLQLWIVGDGSERDKLKTMAQQLRLNGAAVFWGEHLDPARYFSAADVFIMSSDSEGLPLSLLQAFSVGLPAIVTDVGGMAEVVRHSRAGLVVPAADSTQMAAAIIELMGNDTTRRKMSANAQTEFRESFAMDAMANAYMRLYTPI